MRRPLKPFVTEYKGPRRTSQSFNEPTGFESERPASKFTEAKTKPDPDESSYEAAMRAADALFSAPGGRASDDVREEQPGQLAQIGGAATDHVAPDRHSGRILRVIDEAPSPQYAALEAESAPKRRGRKPGSKNKPKVPVSTVGARPQPDAQQSMAHELPIAPSVPQHAATHAAIRQTAMPAKRQLVALSGTLGEPRSDRRYAWARDRLKPGEDWKRRRLPRVCW